MGKSLPDVMGPSQSVSPTLLLEARNLTIDLDGRRARQMWGGMPLPSVMGPYLPLLYALSGSPLTLHSHWS